MFCIVFPYILYKNHLFCDHVGYVHSQGYGMTESTAVATRGFNTDSRKNYYSVGLLSPNMEAKIVDSLAGVFKGPGSMGELWLRGPSIMKGNSLV